MLRRGQTAVDDGIAVPSAPGGVPTDVVPAPRRTEPEEPEPPWAAEGTRAPLPPRLPGDPAMVSGSAPLFRRRGEGYDRAQVDEYVAWVDAELRAQRRATDELVRRYQDCAADLELSRRLLAHSAEGQHLLDVSQQAGRLLAVAADQAAEVVAAGTAEAHRVVAEARVQAQASLDRVRVLREQVLALCESLRRQAQRDRAEARETLAQARKTAERLLETGVSPPPAR